MLPVLLPKVLYILVINIRNLIPSANSAVFVGVALVYLGLRFFNSFYSSPLKVSKLIYKSLAEVLMGNRFNKCGFNIDQLVYFQ